MGAFTPEAIRRLVQADIERRLKELPDELDDWNQAVSANANGWGIHFTQITALRDMMASLGARQQQHFDDLKNCSALETFSNSYYQLLTDLGGAQDLWRVFRIIFEQRQNARLRPMADAADLIGWDCYRTGLQQALRWGILSEDQFRPPPLAFLESTLTPATASRGEPFETLGFSVRQYRDTMLPLPIVLYPIDQAGSMWSMNAIAHEVGHNLDHDLAAKEGKRVSDELRLLSIGRLDNTRQRDWRRWMPEIFADGVAIVLCGLGFVLSMANLAISLAPGVAFRDPDSQAVHPPLFLRLRVLGHMLSLTGTSSAPQGTGVVAFCDAQNRPGWQLPYEIEGKTVANVVMNEPLDILGKHTLLQLNSNLGTEEERIAQLAAYFLDPSAQRPHPEQPVRMPFRAVCAAAARAAFQLTNPDAAGLSSIQKNAETYLNLIPRPAKLAAVDDANRKYLDSLTARLHFRAPLGSEQAGESS